MSHVRSDLVIDVTGLTIDFRDGLQWSNVVNGVSFSLGRGEAIGLVGESGCGKSTIAYSLLGYRRVRGAGFAWPAK